MPWGVGIALAVMGALLIWIGDGGVQTAGWLLFAGAAALVVVAGAVVAYRWMARGNRRWVKVLVPALLVAYAALALYSIVEVVRADSIPSDVCAANKNPTRTKPRDPARRLTLTATGSDGTAGTNLTLALQQQWRVITRRQLLAVQAPVVDEGARAPRLPTGRNLQIVATDFVRTSDAAALPADSVVVNAVVISADRVEVSVCFSPLLRVEQTVAPSTTTTTTVAPTTTSSATDQEQPVIVGAGATTTTTQASEQRPTVAAPGRYTGRVVIVDDRVQRIEIPVDITMQYREWPLMLTIFLGILPFAAFVVFAGQGKNAALRKANLVQFGNWLRDNPVPIGSGVGAALTAFLAKYVNDPAWSGQPGEFLALIATVGGAFVTALTVVAAGKNVAFVGSRPGAGGETNDDDDDPEVP